MVIPSSRRAARAAAGPHGTHPAILWALVLGALLWLCCCSYGLAWLAVLLGLAG